MYLMSALALVSFAACEPNSSNGDNDGDDSKFAGIVEDGFYVAGPATGLDGIQSVGMMTAGTNEADKTNRNGMYEKYVVLEADKEFDLSLYEAGNVTRYSATLESYNPGDAGYAEEPVLDFFRGELKTGADAPAMTVSETGLYHIVLDLNKAGDLAYPQIIVVPTAWGVRGDLNGWGYTPMTMTSEFTADTITWEITEQKLMAGGKFKFAYAHGWKIRLDDAGLVKAETNLGTDCVSGGADIVAEEGGLYTITLSYTMANGAHDASYDMTMTRTGDLPGLKNVYMIGASFGNWNWDDAGVAELTPVHSEPGEFYTIKYLKANDPFKFCDVKDWNGDFTSFGEGSYEGYTIADNNCVVAADGVYTIYIDSVNGKMSIKPAEVYGIGDAFGGWTTGVEANKFAVEGTTLTVTATAAGALRSYVALDGVEAADWWHAEFSSIDGVITPRTADELQGIATLTAGQKVVYDFNAMTCTIQ